MRTCKPVLTLLPVLLAALLSGIAARSLLDNSEELNGEQLFHQRELEAADLNDDLEEPEDQKPRVQGKREEDSEDYNEYNDIGEHGEKGLEKREYEAESADSEARRVVDEREITDPALGKRANTDSEVVLTYSNVMKREDLAKRFYRTHCYRSICIRSGCYYGRHYGYYNFYRYRYGRRYCRRYFQAYWCTRCIYY